MERAGLGRAVFSDVDPNPRDDNLDAGVRVFLDGDTLTEHAESAGWRCEIVREEENGEYLAQLAKA